MELNREGRYELRKAIKNKLIQVHKKNLPTTPKLLLPKDILEKVMFEEVDGSKEVAFSNSLLKYLDLSELSFEGVNMDLENANTAGGLSEVANLSDTNVYIDFSKIKRDECGQICISNYNLRDVDLSNNDFDKLFGTIDKIFFVNCDLTNCKLKITGNASIVFSGCTLSYNDLSELKGLRFDTDYYESGETRIYCDCDISHTKAKIGYDENDITSGFLADFIKSENARGCYIYDLNDPSKVIYLGDAEDNREKREKNLELYREFKQNKIDEIISILDKQINSVEEKKETKTKTSKNKKLKNVLKKEKSN